MQPIGVLMREHRLIERMFDLLDRGGERAMQTGTADVELLKEAIDFMRTYVDRLHHAKEEDIFFPALSQRGISPDQVKLMNQLIADHAVARTLVGALATATEEYSTGNDRSLSEIIRIIEDLAGLYAIHIENEDKRFFYPVQEYLNKKEMDDMLAGFREFERPLIPEKYEKMIEMIESRPTFGPTVT